MFLLNARPFSLFKDSLGGHIVKPSANPIYPKVQFIFDELFENSFYSDLNFYFGFSFFEGPLKLLSQRRDLKMLMDLTFRRKILICMWELLKVFIHLPPP
jgi:hypothetical protein